MNRRDFLKISSTMSAVGFVAVGPMGKIMHMPIETAGKSGQIYRGTHDGKIYVSLDKGKNWQLQANFGSHYPILDIFTARDGHLYAQLGFKHYNFHLALNKDGRTWAVQPSKTAPKPRA